LEGPRLDRSAQVKRAASMLEEIFLRQLLKVMRKTVPEGGLLGKSVGKDIYTEMFDGALATEMARAGGIGLREVLMSQLGGGTPPRSDIGRSAPARGGASPLPPARIGAVVTSALTLPTAPSRAAARLREVAELEPKAAPVPVTELDGVSFEAPNRPEPVRIRDNDGKLGWPSEHARLADDRGTMVAPRGEEILAAGSGTVVQADAGSMVIDHGGGLRTHYVGLGSVEAQPGDLVLRGQAVGTVGGQGSFQFGAQRAGRALGHAELLGIIDGGQG
jgi:flagellar protein FlgJ